MLPIIVIAGKENVGKSTLFNRLVGSRASITHSLPGTTRDCNVKECDFWGTQALIVDTGGYIPYSTEGIKTLVNKQVEKYLQEADIILFVVDILSGITANDLELNAYIRTLGKPIILVINKIDNQRKSQNLEEFYKLGFFAQGESASGGNEVVMISAIHNTGIDTLIDEIQENIPTLQSSALQQSNNQTIERLNDFRFAILGRPNVGKSTYVNALLKENRMIVSEIPGTTIDSIDVTFKYKDKEIILIDTPGLRKRGKIATDLEYYSSVRTNSTISRCDVALLLIDSTLPLTHQDKTLITMLIEKGKGIVLVANKTDLGVGFNESALVFARFIPVCYVSALKGRKIYNPIEEALSVAQARQIHISKRVLGQFIQNNNKVKINSLTQLNVVPPTFRINTNRPLTPSALRFLEAQLRERFGFIGTPIVFTFAKQQ